MPAKTLYLIDGHAQMFRSYFAIRGTANRSGTSMNSPVTGEPTGATFAFTAMLLKLFKDQRPEYVAMAIDTSAPTYRDELYPAYKANREQAPDEFKAQVPRMIEVAQRFGIPILQQQGAEADDILATLATRLASADTRVRLVSKDKDLDQVLGDHVQMFDIHTDTFIGPEELLDKKGITPRQAIDYQALIGDSTDNVPGVKGVGPKTAAKLLEQFGTLDELLAHTDQLKGKQKENIDNAVADGSLELSRQLVTLRRDVEIDFDPADAAFDPDDLADRIDGPALLALFQTLGFSRHQEDLKALLNAKDLQPSDDYRAKTTDHAVTDKTVFAAPAPTPGQAEPPAGSLFANIQDATPQPADTPQPTSAPQAAAEPGPAGEAGGRPTRASSPTTNAYRAITTQAELTELVDQLLKDKPTLAVDTETLGLEAQAGLCGVCLAWRDTSDQLQAVYVPTRSPELDAGGHLDQAAVVKTLRPLLESSDVPKVGHHLKFDYHVLRDAGLTLRGIAYDSLIGGFLAGAPGLKLDDLALALLDHRCTPITDLIGPKPRKKSDPPQITMDRVPLDVVTHYAAEDADVSLRLCEILKRQTDAAGMATLIDTVEVPLIPVLAEMERAGIRVDPDVLVDQQRAMQATIDELKHKIAQAAADAFNDSDSNQTQGTLAEAGPERGESPDTPAGGFNPDSPKQLGDVLFNKLNFPVIKKTKTGFSTDSEVLEKLSQRADMEELPGVPERARAIPALMLEYRQLTKLVGTYLENLRAAIDPADGRVHCTFNQTGAATGRLSANNPNLQNIPIRTDLGRDIRRAFVAEKGHVLISVDYSQIELRMLAHFSEDPALLEAFHDNADIHTAVAAQVFGVTPGDVTREQRGQAKMVNFGIIYGITAFGLSRRLGDLPKAQAQKLIDDYKARFVGIDTFMQACVDHAREHGYVTTILGRRRAVPQVEERNPMQRALGERLAINSVIQGSAADLIKKAMVDLAARIADDHLPATPLLQIHDELVVEAPEPDAESVMVVVKETMQNAMTLKVPLVAEGGCGASWYASK